MALKPLWGRPFNSLQLGALALAQSSCHKIVRKRKCIYNTALHGHSLQKQTTRPPPPQRVGAPDCGQRFSRVVFPAWRLGSAARLPACRCTSDAPGAATATVRAPPCRVLPNQPAAPTVRPVPGPGHVHRVVIPGALGAAEVLRGQQKARADWGVQLSINALRPLLSTLIKPRNTGVGVGGPRSSNRVVQESAVFF